jgi:nicotinamidase-related amidase
MKSVGRKMNRALMVIDVQNEYFDGLLHVTWPGGSLERILQAMEKAKKEGIPVAVVQHSALDGNSPVFRKGSKEWEIHPDVLKKPYDILIEKNWPDCFAETGLKKWLDGHSIDTLVICGYMTQMCCDTTARRAFHLGYRVEFLADATGTLGFTNYAGSVSAEELHRAILVTQTRFSRVINTQEWLKDLDNDSSDVL